MKTITVTDNFTVLTFIDDLPVAEIHVWRHEEVDQVVLGLEQAGLDQPPFWGDLVVA